MRDQKSQNKVTKKCEQVLRQAEIFNWTYDLKVPFLTVKSYVEKVIFKLRNNLYVQPKTLIVYLRIICAFD